MCLRYCCHSPRTEVSVTRDSFDSTPRPPISTTDARADAPATPRCTNPVAAPSSSEMYPAGPTRSEEQRLNSSHRTISYAVFCLKKKKKINHLLFTSDRTRARLSPTVT